MREKPSRTRYTLAGEARGFVFIDRVYIVRWKAETRDSRCNGVRVLGRIGDLQKAVAAAFEIVAVLFEHGPSAPRVEKSGAREAGGDAVVAPHDRMEHAGGIAGRIEGGTFVPVDERDSPSPRRQPFRDRATAQPGADNHRVARIFVLGC